MTAAELQRLHARLEFEAQLAALDARLARIDYELGELEADSRRRRAQAQAGQAAEAERQREHARAVRQAQLTQGLALAIGGSAAALFSAAQSAKPKLGLPELPGFRG